MPAPRIKAKVHFGVACAVVDVSPFGSSIAVAVGNTAFAGTPLVKSYRNGTLGVSSAHVIGSMIPYATVEIVDAGSAPASNPPVTRIPPNPDSRMSANAVLDAKTLVEEYMNGPALSTSPQWLSGGVAVHKATSSANNVSQSVTIPINDLLAEEGVKEWLASELRKAKGGAKIRFGDIMMAPTNSDYWYTNVEESEPSAPQVVMREFEFFWGGGEYKLLSTAAKKAARLAAATAMDQYNAKMSGYTAWMASGKQGSTYPDYAYLTTRPPETAALALGDEAQRVCDDWWVSVSKARYATASQDPAQKMREQYDSGDDVRPGESFDDWRKRKYPDYKSQYDAATDLKPGESFSDWMARVWPGALFSGLKWLGSTAVSAVSGAVTTGADVAKSWGATGTLGFMAGWKLINSDGSLGTAGWIAAGLVGVMLLK